MIKSKQKAGSASEPVDVNDDFGPSSQSFFELIEHASDAIYFHDPRGRLVFLNRKAEELTGYERKELADKHIRVILFEAGERLISEKLKAGHTQGWAEKIELDVRSKSGERIPVELSVTAIIRNKKLVGYEGIARDIRERHRTQQIFEERDAQIHQLNVEIQKMNMKLEESAQIQSEFVSRISHEFRTPLNGIIGYAELLEDKVYGELNQNQMSALENINACASDLLKMVQEVLDLSRVKTNQLKLENQPCTPKELVEAAAGTVAPIAAMKKLAFVTSVENDLPEINVDFKRFYQILVNLASNAVKFTETGKVEIGAVRDGDATGFFVSDTGIGISSELQELIFSECKNREGYPSRYYGGLGLSLSLSRRIIEWHGGEFSVESQPRQGTRFYFTIPFQQAQPEGYL